MEKKPYTPPTLTDHGSVVETTKGIVGYTFEPVGRMWWENNEDAEAPAPKK